MRGPRRRCLIAATVAVVTGLAVDAQAAGPFTSAAEPPPPPITSDALTVLRWD